MSILRDKARISIYVFVLDYASAFELFSVN